MKCVPKEITQNVGAYPHSEMFFWTLTAQTSFKGQEGFQQTIFLVATFSPSPSPPFHPFLLPPSSYYCLSSSSSSFPFSSFPFSSSSSSSSFTPTTHLPLLLTSRPHQYSKKQTHKQNQIQLDLSFLCQLFFAKMSYGKYFHCNFSSFRFWMNAQPNHDRTEKCLQKIFLYCLNCSHQFFW